MVADSIRLKDLRLDFPHLVRVMATLHILLPRGRLVGEKDGHWWWLALSYIATSLLSSNSVLLAVYE